jgi:hypothetical protein
MQVTVGVGLIKFLKLSTFLFSITNLPQVHYRR